MLIIGNDKLGVSGYGTVNEFIIILIHFNQVPFVVDFNSIYIPRFG